MRKPRTRGNGDGTIMEYPGGRFRAQITVNGKRNSKICTTKLEAKRWIRDEVEKGKELVQSPPESTVVEQPFTTKKTVDMFIEETLPKLKNYLRPQTYLDYRRYLTEQISEELGDVPLKDLRRKQINEA